MMFDDTGELDRILGRTQNSVRDLIDAAGMAADQFRNVRDDKFTLGNLSARWNAMTPQSQQNAVIIFGIVAYVVIALSRR